MSHSIPSFEGVGFEISMSQHAYDDGDPHFLPPERITMTEDENIKLLRRNVALAFKLLIEAAPDKQLTDLVSSLFALRGADKMLYRQLLGQTLMNDIIREAEAEHAYREPHDTRFGFEEDGA